jgi:hypothetical protein
MPWQLNLSQTVQNVRGINTPFYASVTCVLKLLLVHFTQPQIYLRYMLKEIKMFFYEKHEKQMRHYKMYCLILYIGSVSGHVPSFVCASNIRLR